MCLKYTIFTYSLKILQNVGLVFDLQDQTYVTLHTYITLLILPNIFIHMSSKTNLIKLILSYSQ